MLHGISKLCCDGVQSLGTDSANIAIQFDTLYIVIFKVHIQLWFMLFDLTITRALKAVNIPSNTYLSPTDFHWIQFRYLLLVSSQRLLISILAPIFS